MEAQASARASRSGATQAVVNVVIIDRDHMRRGRLKDTLRGVACVERVTDRSGTVEIGEVLETAAADVVFVDVGGSQEAAGRVVAEIRCSPAGQNARLIYVGDGPFDAAMEAQAAELGFHACLARPYDIASVEKALYAAAEDIVQHRQSQHQGDGERQARLAAYLEKLRQIRLFQGFSDAQLVRLLRICKARRFQEGATIFREGEPGQHFYVVLAGTVRIVLRHGGRLRELTAFSAGEVFGEMAVVDDAPRSADAVAGTDCVVLELTRELMEREGDPIAHRLIRHISGLLAAKVRAGSR